MLPPEIEPISAAAAAAERCEKGVSVVLSRPNPFRHGKPILILRILKLCRRDAEHAKEKKGVTAETAEATKFFL